jgi:hypothetical protein
MRIGRDGLELERGEAYSLGAVPAGRRVRCLSGTLWITQTGDGRDHIVLPGESFTADRPGRVVLQALRASTFKLVRGEDKAA